MKGKLVIGTLGVLSLALFSCMSPSTVTKRLEINKQKLTKEFFKKHFAEVQKRLKKDKKLLKKGKKPEESLEWYLDAGSVARYAYALKTSFKIWDFADTQINLYEQKVFSICLFKDNSLISFA
jgi:hypothetical protein